jgi:hypothetical protein
MTLTSSTYPLSSPSQNWKQRFNRLAKDSPPDESAPRARPRTSAALSTELDDLWRWGVDTGARRVAIAAHRKGVRHTLLIEDHFGPGAISADLSRLRNELYPAVLELAHRAPPVLVCIEQPSGRYPNPQLLAAWGVILETLHSGLRDHYGNPVMILPVPPGKWKKATLDNGATNTATYLAAAKLRFGASVVTDNPDLAAALWLCQYADQLEIT